jgi:hypothetical protein
MVRLPLGSQVFSNTDTRSMLSSSERSAGNGAPINVVFRVNGTAEDVARKIKQVIMNDLKKVRQFGIA